MVRTKIDVARAAVLRVAEQLKFPEVEKMKESLATDAPGQQFEAFQRAIRQLAQHAGKEALIGAAPIFQKKFSAEASAERQKAQARSLFSEVPDFVAQLTGMENPAAADNGGKPRKRYTEAQRLRIVYAPQLRHRLIKANMWTPCLSLDPSVNLGDEERYPHNQLKSEELFNNMGEAEFFAMFAELQRAATHFFQCPQLEEAKRLNESIADVRRRKLESDYMAYFPDDEAVLPRLLAIADDIDRMQTIMMDKEVTVPLIEAAREAYSRLVAISLAKSAAKITLLQTARATNGTTGKTYEGEKNVDDVQLRAILKEVLGQQNDPIMLRLGQIEHQIRQIPLAANEKALDAKFAAAQEALKLVALYQAEGVKDCIKENVNHVVENILPDVIEKLKPKAAQEQQPSAAAQTQSAAQAASSIPAAAVAIRPLLQRWETWVLGAVLAVVVLIGLMIYGLSDTGTTMRPYQIPDVDAIFNAEAESENASTVQ